MDRLQELAVMQAAAQAGSFVLAAQRLGMSQASVTRAVASLERRLGVPVFDRSTAQVRLTDAGVEFLEHARRISETLDQAGAAALAGLPQARGAITVSAPMGLAAAGLGPVLIAFAAAYPRVDVRCRFHECPKETPDAAADVVLRLSKDRGSPVERVVGRAWRTTAATAAYLDRHGVPKSLKDLSRHRLIDVRTQSSESVWRAMESPRLELVSQVWADSDEAALDACTAGMGLARVWSYDVIRSDLREVLPRYRETPVNIVLHARHSEPWHPAQLFAGLAHEILARQAFPTAAAHKPRK
ncbi:MAG: hypothetical protein DI564_03280 [Rhodanobacter denitrificans]|uniref:HTH lysR-type domain-containing protein n=1 Tax=Rhodanobacter denitrificans TaxID=666685 RepID=A0A2W5KU40_9GAMM|nr:MAG: hypothetical protein DI564_03280 [Rhodanobacter denitrificans]